MNTYVFYPQSIKLHLDVAGVVYKSAVLVQLQYETEEVLPWRLPIETVEFADVIAVCIIEEDLFDIATPITPQEVDLMHGIRVCLEWTRSDHAFVGQGKVENFEWCTYWEGRVEPFLQSVYGHLIPGSRVLKMTQSLNERPIAYNNAR